MRVVVVGLILPLLAACSAAVTQSAHDAVPVSTFPPSPPCPIVSSSDWQAWVTAQSSPNQIHTLHVTGRVTLPWAGWQLYWKNMRRLGGTPTSVEVELDAKPPTMGGQSPDLQNVTGDWPSNVVPGSVVVVCRGKELARITSVRTIE